MSKQEQIKALQQEYAEWGLFLEETRLALAKARGQAILHFAKAERRAMEARAEIREKLKTL